MKDKDTSLTLSKNKQALVAKHQAAETIHNDRYRIGGNIVRSPICFSEDEKTFFCCSGSVVKTYNVATGALLGILEGHTARVTSVVVNPDNNLQVFTTSHDGTVRKWDYIESSCLDAIDVGAPVLQSAIASSVMYLICDPQHYLRELELQKKDLNLRVPHDSWRFVKLDLRSKTFQVVFRCRRVRQITVSTDGQYVVILQHSSFIVYSVSKQCKVTFSHVREFTTIAFHPNQPIIATGDCSGRITLWVNIDKAFSAAALQALSTATSKFGNAYLLITEFHWHANTVSALAFSEDGSYLLSGADEAVLVFWQMSTGQKQYLPRLGAPIMHITTSPRGSLYAVACADNAIRMVNAVNNRVIHHVQGLQHATSDLFNAAAYALASEKEAASLEASLAENGVFSVPTGIVTHPVTGSVTLCGKQGYLQVFDVYTDRHIANIAVVERNYVSQPRDNVGRNQATIAHTKSIRTENGTPMSEVDTIASSTVRVEHAVYSPLGDWLVTVDRWVDGVTAERTSLKFWRDVNANGASGSSMSEFVLNTRSEDAHNGKITSVAYHPTEDLVVTTSTDGTFKLWQLEDISTPSSRNSTSGANASAGAPTQVWVCVSSADYRRVPVHNAAFSSDGSVLAVSFGQVITLWNPNPASVTLRTTLVHPPPSAPVRFLSFVHGSPFLVAATHTSIYVWNVISCSVAWSYHMQTSAVAVHPTLPYFAALVVLPYVPDTSKPTTASISATSEDDKENEAATTGSKKHKLDEESSDDININQALLNKKASKNLALLIFHAESPTPIRVVDASDARFDKTKLRKKSKNKTAATSANGSVGGSQFTDDSEVELATAYTASSVYTSSLAFIHRTSTAPTNSSNASGEDSYAAPLNDISSIVYLNRSKEIIRLPNALHPVAKDSENAEHLLSFARDKERLAAVQTVLQDKPSLFTQLYGKSTAAAAAELSVDHSAVSSINVTNYGNIHSALVAFLKTPAHVLGSLSIVYGNFMDAYLTKRQKTN